MTTEIKPVTIPREVADAIETLRRDSASDPAFDNEGIAHAYVTESYVGPIALNLRKIPFDTLMRALLDGYERELTEEEKRAQSATYVKHRYLEALEFADEDELQLGFINGARFVLDEFGITIEGVNA
ncbi:hypothetical protein NSS79_10365 [Paenibacillus sp. FSL L8-0436]|uniref:hypothetical protein n=1 Tax=Paenibacillus sp. FSL L8-0436 TaxID=2954686 RepID=UPI00315933D5